MLMKYTCFTVFNSQQKCSEPARYLHIRTANVVIISSVLSAAISEFQQTDYFTGYSLE